MKKFRILLILIICIALLAGCGSQAQPQITPLTEEEIAQANEAFVSMAETETGFAASEISCFFTSFYAQPQDIDLSAFLRYCPAGVRLTDADSKEYDAFLAAEAAFDPMSIPGPARRHSKEAVSAILKKYANITVDELINKDNVIYLEAYDAFYNTTSDFAPGTFQCVGGEKDGNTVRLWTETAEDGTRVQLTLTAADGTYYIQSFQQVSD